MEPQEQFLQLPAIRGLRICSEHREPGMVACVMEADDEAAEHNLLCLHSVVRHPIEGRVMILSLKPNQATRAIFHAIVKNRCSNCGCSKFRREFKIGGSPKRIVDMLYCEGCAASMRITGGCPEGLDPSPSSHRIARLIGNLFKDVWGPADVDETYGER